MKKIKIKIVNVFVCLCTFFFFFWEIDLTQKNKILRMQLLRLSLGAKEHLNAFISC